MTAPRFVRYAAALAAFTTALVAAFPLWGVASASEPTAFVSTSHRHDRGERRDRDGEDRREGHGRDKGTPATCTITVPADPLTPTGLATPYVLNDGTNTCSMANPDTRAFVEAAIVDGAGKVAVYRPLVVTHGTEPAVTPTAPQFPRGATVGIWFGFEGDTLRLVGPGAEDCINGRGRSLFGQFAYCNAPAFFAAAGDVSAPPLGTAPDGKPCPTVRDFFVVDQDQSDNVSTVYRIDAQGRTAQDTATSAGLTKVVNASDNGLLNRKINDALGCANFTAPDLTNPGGPSVPSLALNEIQARQQGAPVALIPLNDPMATVNGVQNVGKMNLYREGVGQPTGGRRSGSGTTYCANLKAIQPARTDALKVQLAAHDSPDPNKNLLQFMQDRYTASLGALGC